MFKKLLAVVALTLLCLTLLTPIVGAEEEVLTNLENILATDIDTELLSIPVPKSSTPATEAIAKDSTEAFVSESHSSWGYDEINNEATWGIDHPQCNLGTIQSPINLSTNEFNSSNLVSLNYVNTTFEVVNNGHSVQVNYPAGSTATIDGKTYNLLQFHFHTPSEHTINEKHAEMEIHFVHSNDVGEIAVIGAMMQAGTKNYDISKIWRNIPAERESRRSDLVVHPENLLPETMNYATYVGSLTTPPCTEGVTWIVMQDPVTLSAEQIEAFQALYPMNARSVQRDGVIDDDTTKPQERKNWFF